MVEFIGFFSTIEDSTLSSHLLIETDGSTIFFSLFLCSLGMNFIIEGPF